MYKPGGEDVVGDASAEGSTGRPGRMWKTRGAVRAAMFGLRLIWMCSGGKLCEVVMIWTGADGLCGSEVRMRHVHPEVLVSELNGRSRLTL